MVSRALRVQAEIHLKAEDLSAACNAAIHEPACDLPHLALRQDAVHAAEVLRQSHKATSESSTVAGSKCADMPVLLQSHGAVPAAAAASAYAFIWYYNWLQAVAASLCCVVCDQPPLLTH
jgi:hypothetical protein